MLPPPDIRGTYRTDSRARAAYAEAAGIYRILPQAVCLPASHDDLKRLLAWAGEHRIALVPRGAGSAMAGGNVGEGVMVDLTRLADRRLEIDPASGRAVTGTGVTFAELNQAAMPYGLRLPPDPSSGRWATLGGMVSTNAAGASSLRYGSVRRWVEGLTLLTADGEAIGLRRGEPAGTHAESATLTRFEEDAGPLIRRSAKLIRSRFPNTRKNSSGYALDAYLGSGDVLDLLIGAEGTLGIVTEIEWRLDPIPPCQAALRIDLPSLDHLGEVVAVLDEVTPSALELLDRTFLELLGAEGGGLDLASEAILLVRLEGASQEALQGDIARAAAAVRPWATSVQTAPSLPDAERLWAIRHAASPILAGLPEDRRSLQVIEDACVPVARMSDYIRLVRRAAAARDLQVVLFGHAGDGHIHVNLLPRLAREGWEADVTSLLSEVTDGVISLGGTPSGEHGDGRLRAGMLEHLYGAEIVSLFWLVKRAFDPLGILNPGVILPCPEGPHGGEPPIGRLKVGTTAVPLPADIARALREIELSGGYARCRLELAGGEEVEGRASTLDPRP
ncbi:MAG TPA: FAD-binding oxidoreductase [Gemmatimonadales bacterium]|nr:FAD-binding oxidoreductase [Gemmatimonadales bacterium]